MTTNEKLGVIGTEKSEHERKLQKRNPLSVFWDSWLDILYLRLDVFRRLVTTLNSRFKGVYFIEFIILTPLT